MWSKAVEILYNDIFTSLKHKVDKLYRYKVYISLGHGEFAYYLYSDKLYDLDELLSKIYERKFLTVEWINGKKTAVIVIDKICSFRLDETKTVYDRQN